MIERIETHAFGAWPSRTHVMYDGWAVRYGEGYTKRANSVTPLTTGTLPHAQKIRVCEQRFEENGLRPTFRLSPLGDRDALDASLAERGWQAYDETAVQVMPNPYEQRQSQPLDSMCELSQDRAQWARHFYALSEKDSADFEAHVAILERISVPACFAVRRSRGEVVAAGIGVSGDGLVGLFDLVTARDKRRQGHARAIIHSLLQWSAEVHSADTAYLQVMTNNAPALALYEKIGFKTAYTYWYRSR